MKYERKKHMKTKQLLKYQLLALLTGLAVFAALLAMPGTARGQMFVSVNSNPFTNGGSRIYQYDPTGSTGTPVMPYFLDNLDHPREVAFDSHGNLYIATFTWLLDSAGEIVDFDHGTVLKVSGGVTSSFATFNGGSAHGLAFDSAGNLFVSSANSAGTESTIYKITPDGVVSTFGFDETIQGSVPGQCFDLKVDSAGNLFAAGADSTLTYGTIYEFPTEGPLAGVRSIFVDSGAFSSGDSPIGLIFDAASGNLFVSTNGNDGTGKIRSFDSNGMEILPPFATGLTNNPRGLAFDSAGNLFCAEIGNGALVGDILKFTPEGTGTIPGVTTDPTFGVNYFAQSPTSDFGARGNRGPEYVAFAPEPITPPSTAVVLTFPNTTETLTTTLVTAIDQYSVPPPPSNFELETATFPLAYEITADTPPTPPIIIAFTVPSSLEQFDPSCSCYNVSALKALHYENGNWVDSTIYPGDPNYPTNPAPDTVYASVNSLSPFLVAKFKYGAQVQQPINADRRSVFSVRRGVIPVKFTLTNDGSSTCTLPPATIAVTRTAGGTIGAIDESVYSGSADTGSNFRIASCQYAYNLSASALGVGTYRVDIKIHGTVVGSGVFGLK
jgi:sugar lactone lactonase YvrE